MYRHQWCCVNIRCTEATHNSPIPLPLAFAEPRRDRKQPAYSLGGIQTCTPSATAPAESGPGRESWFQSAHTAQPSNNERKSHQSWWPFYSSAHAVQDGICQSKEKRPKKEECVHAFGCNICSHSRRVFGAENFRGRREYGRSAAFFSFSFYSSFSRTLHWCFSWFSPLRKWFVYWWIPRHKWHTTIKWQKTPTPTQCLSRVKRFMPSELTNNDTKKTLPHLELVSALLTCTDIAEHFTQQQKSQHQHAKKFSKWRRERWAT